MLRFHREVSTFQRSTIYVMFDWKLSEHLEVFITLSVTKVFNESLSLDVTSLSLSENKTILSSDAESKVARSHPVN